jgi:hypothetical protein
LDRNEALDVQEALKHDQANARGALVGSRQGLDNMNTVGIDANGDIDMRPAETPSGDDVEMVPAPNADTPVMGPKPNTNNVSPLDENRKRKREEDDSLSNSTDTTDMSMEVQTTAKSAGSAGTATSINSETPVDMKVPREFNIFTETRTVILPLTVYWSHFGIINDNTNSNYTIDGGDQYAHMIRLRLNDPLNLLSSMQFRNSAVGTGERGTHIRPMDQGNALNLDREFPTTLILDGPPASNAFGNAKTRPGMWAWYAKQYQHYHVIKTKYKLTFQVPTIRTGTQEDHKPVLYIQHDVITENDATNVMPRSDTATRPFQLQRWKRIQHKKLNGRRDSNGYENDIITVDGEWEYGKWKGNTTNQEEIKTWYPTKILQGEQTISPTWREELVIVPRLDEFSTANAVGLNVKCEIYYEVQFKDLKPSWRYPLHGAAINTGNSVATEDANVLIMPNDMRQHPVHNL